MVENEYFILYQKPNGLVVKCAYLKLVENNRKLEQLNIAYHEDFLDEKLPNIAPFHLDYHNKMQTLTCQETPGFLDDILPDKWGRTVLARLHDFGHSKLLTASEILNVGGHSTIGALSLVKKGADQEPSFHLGCELKFLDNLEETANAIESGKLTPENIARYKLAMLGRGSSAIGGARPKVLVHDKQKGFLAKFQKEGDKFDYAIVEKSCLDVINLAGFKTAQCRIIQVNNKSTLLVERFDLSKENGRYNQATFNALLKEKGNHRDLAFSRYDDFISKLASPLSDNPSKDYEQLFGQMLFNRLFNNTDDHLRNFSFQTNEKTKETGWQLTPIYDVVPSLNYGEYHQNKCQYSDFLPLPSEAERYGKLFRLTKSQTNNVIERVEQSYNKFEQILIDNNVTEGDLNTLKKRFNF